MIGQIIQERITTLSRLSRRELEQLLGRPAEHLVMGEDERPYLMTSVVMRRPDGAIWAHVYVATGGWDEADPVIKSAALTSP
ncbi:hypothetical protein [Rugosimonospora acidiphila]